MSRERVIGLVLSHGYAYYRRILRGIARFAERRPHWRFVSTAPELGGPVHEVLKNVDVAIAGVDSLEWCHVARRSRARVVNVSCIVPNLPLRRVGVDNQVIGSLAAEHFLERGLRSFAFVGHPRFLYSTEREQAFRAALERAGYTVSVFLSDFQRAYDVTGCMQHLDYGVTAWLENLPRPTGILAATDAWAVDLLQLCGQLNVRIPEDFAVLGVDDDDLYCEMTRPRLSSVIVPGESIGIRAAECAEQLVDRGQPSMTRDELIPPPGVAVRRSTDMLAIDDPIVVAAVRYIRENGHRNCSVSDVLRVVPISRRALERRVLECFGHTLGDEIRRTRLESAKRLLTETDMSIAEVALQSGFSDSRHLSVTFRHALAQTPSHYRRVTGRRGG